MDKITAPFSETQVNALNLYQESGAFHPFTCCSPEEIKECQRIARTSEGILIARKQGWICPCGKYTQHWAWLFMAEYPLGTINR